MMYRIEKHEMAIRKAAVYLLLFLSLVFYGRGWITFSNSMARRSYAQDAEKGLSYIRLASSSQIEEIAQNLEKRGLYTTPETLMGKMEDVYKALRDGAASPKDIKVLTGTARWLCKLEAESEYSQNPQEAEDYMKNFGRYSTISTILFYLTIVVALASIVALILRVRIGVLGYCAVSFLQFFFFIILRTTSAYKVAKLFDLFSFMGFSNTSVDTRLKLCAPMFLSLFFAIASGICWVRLLDLAGERGKKIPSLFSTGRKVRNVSKTRIHRKSAPDPRCPACGAVLEEDGMFCGNCGKRIDSEQVENSSDYSENKTDTKSQDKQTEAPDAMKMEKQVDKKEDIPKRWISNEPIETVDEDVTVFVPNPKVAPIPSREIILTDMENTTAVYSVILGNGSSVLVGREDEADLQITHNRSVSRRHCRLTMENDSIFVQDAGSRFGTSVDDTKAEQDQLLKLDEGCILTLGTCRLMVQINE